MEKILIVISTALGLSAHAAQWTYNPQDGLLTHDTQGWVLVAEADGNNLTVTGIDNNNHPHIDSPLPLADPVVGGFTITEIGAWAFAWDAYITEATIPGSVETIGDCAFLDCYNLWSLGLGQGVKHIGAGAFVCTGLESVTIPASVETMAYGYVDDYDDWLGAFSFCGELENLAIEPGVAEIGPYAFWSCGALTNVVVPGSVESIGDGAFFDCYNLWNLTLGQGIKHIGTGAFTFTALEHVTIPASVETMAYDYVDAYGEWFGAFSFCEALESLVIEPGLAGIGRYAFRECGGLENVTIPGSVETIGDCAFADCYNLSTFTLGQGVKHIGAGAFAFTALESATIPGSVETMGYAYVDLYDDFIGAFTYCEGLQSLVIEPGVAEIGPYAFGGCNSLSDVTIPGSVENIEWCAFFECRGMETLVLQAGVKRIGNNAFYGCGSLETVVVPGSVERIGDGAFVSCGSLQNLILQPGVARIDGWAFEGCYNLENVTIPGSVSSIGYGAFAYCDGLQSLVIGSGVARIDSGAFEGCYNLASVAIPASVGVIGSEAFAYCSALENLTIEPGVGRIGENAFLECESLGNVIIPASVTSIGSGIFSGCWSLESVTFEGECPGLHGGCGYFEPWDDLEVTTYVYALHAASWEANLDTGSLALGNAVWQGRPIMMLPDPRVTATLDPCGGTVSPAFKNRHYGLSYGAFPEPIRMGYVFGGWWTDPNGTGVAIDSNTLVGLPRNHTLYAKWFEDVTFYAQETLGASTSPWLTDDTGHGWWDDSDSYDGGGSMRSGYQLPHNSKSTLQTTMTGPGVMQFYWKVSSEEGKDFLRFYLDDEEKMNAISGEVDWKKVTVVIPAGEHTLKWVYEKDYYGAAGSDCGWLDAVVWPVVAETPQEHFWLWTAAAMGGLWLPENLLLADSGFSSDIQSTPGDYAARIYRALTTLALLAENENLHTLANDFGVFLGDNFSIASAEFTGNAAPPSNDAVDRLAAEALPAIEAALADLDAIPISWTGNVELTADQTGFDETVYIDIADVLFAKALLYSARAAVQMAQAYDLSVDYGSLDYDSEPEPQSVYNDIEVVLDGDASEWASVPKMQYLYKDGLVEYMKVDRSESQYFVQLKLTEPVSDLLDELGEMDFYINISLVNFYYDWAWFYFDGYQEGSLMFADYSDIAMCASNDVIEMAIAIPPEYMDEIGQISCNFYAYTFDEGCGCNGYSRSGEIGSLGNTPATSNSPKINQLLRDHPDALTVRDAAKFPLAKESLRLSLQTTQAADAAITSRTDNVWHFIEYTPESEDALAEARRRTVEALASLDAPQQITVPTRTETVHLGALFEPAYLTRALAPRFTDGNEVILGSFPDPTFCGAIPSMTMAEETNLVGRVAVMKERAFQMDGHWFNTGGHAVWSHEAGVAQSGSLWTVGKTTWLETTVAGPGALDFDWALTLDRELYQISSLAVYIDGVRHHDALLEDDGWNSGGLEIPEGRHTVRWVLSLDYNILGPGFLESSHGWLTGLVLDSEADHTITTPVDVPHSWLDQFPTLFDGLPAGDYEAAARLDQDEDGYATWQEFVAGTVPTNPASVFTATISHNANGELVVGWTPDLGKERTYELIGTDTLTGGWGPPGNASRFFRVKVSLP